jgi:hypothetical protein
MFLSVFVHSLSRYDGLEAWQTSKSQNRRPLFDVELVPHRAQIICLNFISAIGRLLHYTKIQ